MGKVTQRQLWLNHQVIEILSSLNLNLQQNAGTERAIKVSKIKGTGEDGEAGNETVTEIKLWSKPQTLEQVGTHFGVTKERIRQLEVRALNKLRRFAQEEKIEVPGEQSHTARAG